MNWFSKQVFWIFPSFWGITKSKKDPFLFNLIFLPKRAKYFKNLLTQPIYHCDRGQLLKYASSCKYRVETQISNSNFRFWKKPTSINSKSEILIWNRHWCIFIHFPYNIKCILQKEENKMCRGNFSKCQKQKLTQFDHLFRWKKTIWCKKNISLWGAFKNYVDKTR